MPGFYPQETRILPPGHGRNTARAPLALHADDKAALGSRYMYFSDAGTPPSPSACTTRQHISTGGVRTAKSHAALFSSAIDSLALEEVANAARRTHHPCAHALAPRRAHVDRLLSAARPASPRQRYAPPRARFPAWPTPCVCLASRASASAGAWVPQARRAVPPIPPPRGLQRGACPAWVPQRARTSTQGAQEPFGASAPALRQLENAAVPDPPRLMP